MSDYISTPSALDGLLAITNAAGKPLVRDRFRSVGDAYSAYRELREGDRLSALNRIRYQMQLDGEPPYTKNELRKYGLATIANVNFGFMEDAMIAASAPYEDLVDGSEVIMRLPTKYGTEAGMRQELESVIEEEFTNLVTNDEGFDYRLAELTRQFNLHGVAVPYFENELCITWKTSETGNFLLPRDIRASEDAVELAACTWEYLPHELYQCIEDRTCAECAGWNVDETWRAIKEAAPNTQLDDDIEMWQEQWKNNDLGMSYTGKSKTIRAVIMWVRGLDGKVTQLIFKADGTSKDYLFKSPNRYGSISQAFTIFTDGVGTNGKFHGIRGIGYKIYSIVKEMNELWSGFLDAIRMSSKQFIQPKTEAAAKNLALVEFGHFMVMPPSATFLDRAIPNYGQNIIPGLNMLTQLLNSKSGQYTTAAAFDQNKEQTRTEILARLDQVTKLSLTKVKIFYKAWTRLNREVVRRVMRKDWAPSDPDYDRVMEFYSRCEERGVPREAIWAIDLNNVRAVHAAGNGSPEARSAMYDRLMAMFQQYDAEGQHSLLRGATLAIGGKELADTLAPKKPGQRPPIDKKIADLENAAFTAGTIAVVEPNEMHSVHVVEHLTGPGGLLELTQKLRAGQIGYEAIPVMRAIHDHCAGNPDSGVVGHMEFIAESGPDGKPNMERAGFKEALQQTDEEIYNGEKHLEAEQRKAAEAQQAEGGQQEQDGALGFTANKAAEQAQVALEKVKADVAAKELLTQQELDHNERRFLQEQAIQKAKADAEIAAAIIAKTRGKPEAA